MRWARALLMLSLGSGCRPTAPAASSQAITNSTPTDGDLGVVALLRGGGVACTATLIAPRVLLTAGHCLAGAAPAAYFGSLPAAGSATIAIADTHVHPDFDGATLANDVGLALLADPAPAGALPWPLPLHAVDAIGTPLRLLGFGRTSAGDASPPRKREGTTVLAAATDTDFTFAPSPSQTCEGDSGGPAFATLDGMERVVGVTSSGDPACAQLARDVRVDAYAAFIDSYVAATTDGSAGPGERCWLDATCAEGTCAPALDDPARSFCATPCGGGCPAGLACLADAAGVSLCRHPSPTPGSLGAPCADASECTDGECAAAAGGAQPVCTRTCFPDLPGFCPSGYACRSAAGGSACFAEAHGGCSIAPAADPPWPLVLAASLIAALRGLHGAKRARRRSTARSSTASCLAKHSRTRLRTGSSS